MTKQEFLAEIKSVVGIKKETIAKLKSAELPILMFGTGKYAAGLTKTFNNVGIPLAGYAVDEKYYKPEQKFLGLPIFNFDAIVATEPKKYIFIVGLRHGKRMEEFYDDSRITKYAIFHDSRIFFMDYDYIVQNQDKFFETYNLLADDLSKKTLIAYLKGHITSNSLYQKDLYIKDSYFNELTRTRINKGGGYVDCGAGPFFGDTVSEYIQFVDGNYEKIFAFEPILKSFNDLKKIVQENGYKNVELFNCGVSDKNGTMTFYNDKTSDSAFIWSKDVVKDLKVRQSIFGEDFVLPVQTIDDTVGDFPIGFIKMDIEGSELDALKGAVKTLKNSQPALAVCVYHKKEDLITIPQFLKDFYPDAKFYLRKELECGTLYDLVLYALPD